EADLSFARFRHRQLGQGQRLGVLLESAQLRKNHGLHGGRAHGPTLPDRAVAREALTTPALLSQRERREKDRAAKKAPLLLSPLSLRERGVRGVRASKGMSVTILASCVSSGRWSTSCRWLSPASGRHPASR